MQAAFVIGVNESHDKVISKDILRYFGISIYYKEISPSITASIASVTGLAWAPTQKSTSVVYGIEISPSMQEDCPAKLIAEHTINSFVDFMYTHYKLEYDHYSEILCIKSSNELMHLYQPVTVTPEQVNYLEFNITVSVAHGTPGKITTDLKETLSVDIARAGFKLNMACVLLENSDPAGDDSPTPSEVMPHAKIYFNINTSHDVRTWIHAIKRKAKKKFHCIQCFKFEEMKHHKDDIDEFMVPY